MNNAGKREEILALLQSQGEALTDQLNGICYRYAARIHELRKAGHPIVTERVGANLFKYVYKAA